jgi:hypothetical protein
MFVVPENRIGLTVIEHRQGGTSFTDGLQFFAQSATSPANLFSAESLAKSLDDRRRQRFTRACRQSASQGVCFIILNTQRHILPFSTSF